MKLLIFGAGVIGSIFAAKLSLSGHDVTVLARGKRIGEIQENGVMIRNPKTNRIENAKVKIIDSLAPQMKFDCIFVVMQRTQVDAVLDNLARNVTENIVFIVNTAAGYDHWKRVIGAERLLFGFPAAGGERRDGVVNYFIGKGIMRAFQTTTFGEASGEKTKRVMRVIRMFTKAGIPSVHCSDMNAWQKTHVAVVTSIANALYGYGCDNRRLAASWRDVKEMVLGIREGIAVLKRLGIQPTPRKLRYFNLPAGMITIVFKLFIATQLAEITMAKHCIAARAALISLQEEFDRLINASNMQTPHIDSLRKNLYIE